MKFICAYPRNPHEHISAKGLQSAFQPFNPSTLQLFNLSTLSGSIPHAARRMPDATRRMPDTARLMPNAVRLTPSD
jgi:hypothetical protein